MGCRPQMVFSDSSKYLVNACGSPPSIKAMPARSTASMDTWMGPTRSSRYVYPNLRTPTKRGAAFFASDTSARVPCGPGGGHLEPQWQKSEDTEKRVEGSAR